MFHTQAIALMDQALWLVLVLSAPPILAASIAGFLIAVAQSATQIQDQTIQYTVKFMAIVATIFITAALLGGSLYAFSNGIFDQLPRLAQQ